MAGRGSSDFDAYLQGFEAKFQLLVENVGQGSEDFKLPEWFLASMMNMDQFLAFSWMSRALYSRSASMISAGSAGRRTAT